MEHPDHSASTTTGPSLSFSREIREATGINPARCYQCGKCSAGCPMAEEMATKPHQMLRMMQLGQRQQLLEDPSIWLCLTCETCTARCPNEVEPARLIDAVRGLAVREFPTAAPRPIRAFHRAFLQAIAANGRIFEFGMIANYKLKSGDLFSDVLTAPGMLARGKLKLLPSSIDGVADVRRIFAACAAGEEK
jgi:heterodisulfide reductase subunit C2